MGIPTVDITGMDSTFPSPAMSRVRKTFWKGGGLLGALFLTFLIGNAFVPRDKAFTGNMFGHDFLPTYTAGQCVHEGRIDELYDADATRAAEHVTVRTAGIVIHNEFGAFLNPPFAALPIAPLAALPYRTALMIWTGFLGVCLGGAVVLIIGMFPSGTSWTTWALMPLLLFTALPVWQAGIHAQNTFFSLLVLAISVSLWRGGRPTLAGAAAGVLLFKPQLAIILIAVMAIVEGRRALLGAAMTGAVLLLITVIAMPGALAAYLHLTPGNLRAIQALPNYTWHRHVTFLAFWRILLQGHVGTLPSMIVKILAFICMAAMGTGLAVTVYMARKKPWAKDRLIAATITSMPLLMPYFMDYDMTLLCVAAVLCAVDAMKRGVDRKVVWAWAALYLVLEVNPGIAGSTRFILAVPALMSLAGVLMYNAASAKSAAGANDISEASDPSSEMARNLAA